MDDQRVRTGWRHHVHVLLDAGVGVFCACALVDALLGRWAGMVVLGALAIVSVCVAARKRAADELVARQGGGADVLEEIEGQALAGRAGDEG